MGSWMWRKLLKYRDLAKHFHRVQIGSGDHTSFWFDHWSPLGRLIDITGPRGKIDLGITLHATVATAIRERRPRHHRADCLNDIETELRALKEEQKTGPDIALWKSSAKTPLNYRLKPP